MKVITLRRHGFGDWLEKTLEDGTYISLEPHSTRGWLAKIYKNHDNYSEETFRERKDALVHLERSMNIKISDEIEAYVVSRSSIETDIYDTAAVYCEYSKTFRTPVENYLIATLNEDGSLDFSDNDMQIRKKIESIPEDDIRHLQNHAKWIFGKKGKKDNVWTAWLLSQYMKKTNLFKTKKATAEQLQKCSVNALNRP